MSTLRALIAKGAHADAMIPINPTVTWPNHTTLITGFDVSVHHVMANGEIEFPSPGDGPVVKPRVPKDELVHVRTLYEALAEKGTTTGLAPDLNLTADPGYAFWAGEDGPLTQDVNPTVGTHGYNNTDPEMQALFVASGSHNRASINLGTVPNLRVAPTIGKLLGVSLPATKEQPLDAALH
jgi:hypothetical protein